MFEEYKYRVEAHCHTNPVSGCSEIYPADLVKNYKEKGVDAVLITNHFTPDLKDRFTSDDKALDFYFNDYELAKQAGDKLGVAVLWGLEIRFTENTNDYLLYGIDRDDAKQVLGLLGGGLCNFRQQFHSPRSILIQAHPCRSNITPIDLTLVDGIEAFNMHPHHNSRVAFAAKIAQQSGLITTCGTDYHHLTHEASGLMCFKRMPKDNYDFVTLLRSKEYVFDINGFTVIPPQK